MKQIRNSVFETNSSSTHSLSFYERQPYDDWIKNQYPEKYLGGFTEINFLPVDEMYKGYFNKPKEKLEFIFTDIFCTRQYENDESLEIWKRLIKLIEKKHNVKIKQNKHLSEETCKLYKLKKFSWRNRAGWSDGNADSVICLNHTKWISSAESFEQRFKNLVKCEFEKERENLQSQIDTFVQSHEYVSSESKTHYNWGLFEEMDILCARIKFLESGHKFDWKIESMSDAIPFIDEQDMYDFIIDDRFALSVDRD